MAIEYTGQMVTSDAHADLESMNGFLQEVKVGSH
jgi:hypothetical protein